MPSFRAHSVRFAKAEPEAIMSMAHCPVTPLLAVARADATVEVWETRHSPVLRTRIGPAPGQQASVECVGWGAGRLYSCGLHGQVVEYDLLSQCEAKRHPVTSGPAWCLAIDKEATTMAVGTEEGFVCLFSLTSEGLEYLKVLDRQEGRILCLAWHVDGLHLATGSTDTIRVWNSSTGHPTARMTTGRTERNKETIVWCVALTPDMTVISGDSRGKTSFWNGRNGTLMDSVQSHKADVLCIAVSQDQTKAYSCGVDPTLMHFQVIQKSDGRNKWVKSLHRVISTHDVRSLVSMGDRLYSGGVDTYLQVSTYPGRHVDRFPYLPRSSALAVASPARLFMVAYKASLEVWKLGSTDSLSGALGTLLPLSGSPSKLLEVSCKPGERVTASAIHPSGRWLVYSTDRRLRLLRMEEEDGAVTRVPVPAAGVAHQLGLLTYNDEVRLMVCGKAGGISLYGLSVDEGATPLAVQSPAELGVEGGVRHLSVGDTMAVIADHNDNVVAVSLANLEVVAKLPSYSDAALACLAVNPECTTAVLVYANQRVMEVSLATARYTPFSQSLASQLPRGWLSRRTAVTGVTYVKEKPDLILMHDDNTIAVLDKEKDMPEPSAKLVYNDPRSTPSDDQSQDGSSYCPSLSPSSTKELLGQDSGLRMSRKYCHLLGLMHLQGDEVVAVEVKPAAIEELLPPSLKQKKFGGS